MSTCEVCGKDVQPIETLAVEIAGKLHYVCSDEHASTLLNPEPVKAEELPPLEDAPRPPARRGRPAGSKNKPKA